jgi:DNA-binding MarR family transcriptional regulator
MPSRHYQDAAALRAAMRRLTHTTEQVAKRHKLTPRRYELLLFVQAANENGARATVTSLCEPLQTTPASVTQLVDGAVRAGLLKRTTIPNDRRSSHLQLTARGRQRLDAVYTALGRERENLAQIVGQMAASLTTKAGR